MKPPSTVKKKKSVLKKDNEMGIFFAHTTIHAKVSDRNRKHGLGMDAKRIYKIHSLVSKATVSSREREFTMQGLMRSTLLDISIKIISGKAVYRKQFILTKSIRFLLDLRDRFIVRIKCVSAI